MRLFRAITSTTAIVVAAVALASPAHADSTATVQQICAEAGAGLVPMVVAASAELTCGDPAYWRRTGTIPGLFISAPPPLSQTATRLHQGAYPVDTANPWSDWVIPTGSEPAPPTGPAPYMWQTDPGVWQGPCPPTCP